MWKGFLRSQKIRKKYALDTSRDTHTIGERKKKDTLHAVFQHQPLSKLLASGVPTLHPSKRNHAITVKFQPYLQLFTVHVLTRQEATSFLMFGGSPALCKCLNCIIVCSLSHVCVCACPREKRCVVTSVNKTPMSTIGPRRACVHPTFFSSL